MTYTTLDEINGTDLASVLTYPTVNNTEFYPLLLFAIFTITTFLTFFREIAREGKGDILSSLAVGAFVNIAVTSIFMLIRFIDYTIGITSLVISILIVIFYLSSNKN